MADLTRERIIIAGGSGFLGQYLADTLIAQNYEVIILTRSPRQPNHVYWDGATQGDWTEALDGSKTVINLTGKSVNCRYTPENRREIIDSR